MPLSGVSSDRVGPERFREKVPLTSRSVSPMQSASAVDSSLVLSGNASVRVGDKQVQQVQ